MKGVTITVGRPEFRWYDLWLGVFVERHPKNPNMRLLLYVCLVPMVAIPVMVWDTKRRAAARERWQEIIRMREGRSIFDGND